MKRKCISCDKEIPSKRLKAIPDAIKCVPCVLAGGDVNKIKRHDDYIGEDGDEVVETYYTEPNQYIETAKERMMNNKVFIDPEKPWVDHPMYDPVAIVGAKGGGQHAERLHQEQ